MIRTKPIRIPDDRRFKSFANGYVYYKGNTTWNREKQHSADDRVCVGKQSKDRPGYFLPNANYSRLFPDAPVLVEPDEIDDYLHFGSYLALRESASKCGALKALKEAFPDTWEQILAYSVFMIENETNRSQKYEKWGFSNYSGLDHVMKSEEASRLFSSISFHDSDLFLKKYFGYYSDSGISTRDLVIAFDSTNISTFSDHIETAEFGHAKKKEKLPIVSTAMGVDEETGIPIYYEDFVGSLLDKTQIEATEKKIKEIGFDRLFLVFDRGYYKSAELKKLSKSNSFAIMVPDNVTTSFAYIKDNGFGIRDNELYFISGENAYGIQLESDSFLDMHTYTYIFYDGQTAGKSKDTIHSKILNAKRTLSHEKYSKEIADDYSKFFRITKGPDGKNVIEEKREAIQEEIDYCGFFMALSNQKLTPEEMLRRLRKRDRAEKTFAQMKTGLDGEKSYCHGTNTYMGKNFVLFFSLVTKLAFRFFERSYFDGEGFRSNDTTSTVLGHVSKMTAYKTKDGWQRKYALTSKMKTIFKNLDYDEKKIDGFLKDELSKSV